MIDLFILLGVLFAVGTSGFFSGVETAAYSVNSIELHAKAAAGNKSAKLVLRLLSNMPRLITTMLIGTNLSIFIATDLLTNVFIRNSIKNEEFFTTLLLTPFCFLFAESIPKRIAFEVPNIILFTFIRALLIFEIIFYPIAVVLSGFGSLLQYILDKKSNGGSEFIGKVRLYESLEAKTAEGRISLDQYQMASRVMEHETRVISELMINPLETFTVDEDMTCRDAGKFIRDNGYARALIRSKYRRFTGEIVTINSIMNLDNMLDAGIGLVSEDAMLLDRQTPILHAISKMREEGARIAIVTSRNGAFVGSVQLNSLLNSIVHGINEDK